MRGRLRWALAGALALLLTWLGTMTVLLVFPRVDHPDRADAVLVLGPPGQARLGEGVALVKAGMAPTLVISVPKNLPLRTQRYADDVCANPPAGVRVICFDPDPSTTRGEGRRLAALAVQNQWRSVVVVTSTYHISRARYIIGHCTSIQVQMVEPAHQETSLFYWAYQYFYQSAGYVKALFQRSC